MKLLPRSFRRRRKDHAALAAQDQQLVNYIRNAVMPPKVPADYDPRGWVGAHGIDLHEADQLARIARWQAEPYQQLFRELRSDPKINCGFAGQNYLGGTCLHIGWYPTPDAEIYAAMIHDFQPDQIVEVGSGFSTLIARRALDFVGSPAPLTVIDPQPRTDVRQAAKRVVLERVEDCDWRELQLTERSLLFIDSSHITRPRGDVPYLYCQVLPQLPRGTVVHVHDVFIPYDYPTCYDALCWTEQYVLHALLGNNARYRTLLATSYLCNDHAAEMQATFGPQVGAVNIFFGASYWMQIQ